MFKRILKNSATVSLLFEGQEVLADGGDTVAAALLGAGIVGFRHALPVNSSDHQRSDTGLRGPHCMIGNCFECLVEIDGQPNQQSCRIRVREGMHIKRQVAYPETDGSAVYDEEYQG